MYKTRSDQPAISAMLEITNQNMPFKELPEAVVKSTILLQNFELSMPDYNLAEGCQLLIY